VKLFFNHETFIIPFVLEVLFIDGRPMRTSCDNTLQEPQRGWAPSILAGGRDQEDRSLKPVQVNTSQDPIVKNPSQK
jgi:hypothetical protein